MNRSKEIAKLQLLASVMLDHRLASLQTAARAKAQSEAALAGLARPTEVDGLEGAAGALAGLQYQRWAEARRAEINLTLARQTRDWMDAQGAAREAFGKADALKGVAAKLAK